MGKQFYQTLFTVLCKMFSLRVLFACRVNKTSVGLNILGSPQGLFILCFKTAEVMCTRLFTDSLQTLKLHRVIRNWPPSDSTEVSHIQGPCMCVCTAEGIPVD